MKLLETFPNKQTEENDVTLEISNSYCENMSDYKMNTQPIRHISSLNYIDRHKKSNYNSSVSSGCLSVGFESKGKNDRS